MVYKSELDMSAITTLCSTGVKQDTGWDIEFAVKYMDEGIDIDISKLVNPTCKK